VAKVIIMRGLPGSGKSTWIKNNVPDPKQIFSADNYHILDGVYQYDPVKASWAHNQCLKTYVLALAYTSKEDPTTFIVDNTNTTVFDIFTYVRIAAALGIEFEIVHMDCDIGTSVRRNIHNVPLGVIEKMDANLKIEELPFGWKQTVVTLPSV